MKVRFALKARTGFMAFLLPFYGVEQGEYRYWSAIKK